MKQDPLDRHPDDEMYRVFRASLTFLPGVGGMLLELLGGIVVDPAQKRRDAFLRSLLERIRTLEQMGLLDIGELAKRAEVSAAVLRAVSAAVRELQDEKLAYLRNAVLNTVLYPDLESSVRSLLFALVERATEAHVRILQYAWQWQQANTSSSTIRHPMNEAELLVAELRRHANAADLVSPVKLKGGTYVDQNQFELRRAIITDLTSMGLTRQWEHSTTGDTIYSWSTNPDDNGYDAVAVTRLGESFLRLITEPAPLAQKPHNVEP